MYITEFGADVPMPQTIRKALIASRLCPISHNLTLAANSFVNQVNPCSPAPHFYYVSVSMATAPYDYP